MINCLKCGSLTQKFGLNKARKKFCSEKCRTRYNAYKLYLKLKDNPEYKEKAKQRFDKWLKKNRKHYNALSLGYYHEAMKNPEKRERRRILVHNIYERSKENAKSK